MAETIKVEQLTEQSTTSATFVDVPGTSLVFTPDTTGDIWLVFASGVLRSSSTAEQSNEMRLLINGTEEDLWSHQNNAATAPNGAGFLIFERITGTVAAQTVKLQYRAIAGTVFADNVRVVVARLPANADFQFFQSNATVSSTGTNLVLNQLQFTPSSAGDYLMMGSVKHREFPSGSTSQAWFECVGAPIPLHPNAPAGVRHSNARDAWNPLTLIWEDNLAASLQTFNIRFTSSGTGGQASEHRYRKIMLFRKDAFDSDSFSLAPAQTTTTSASFQTKNSIAEPAPPDSREYLTIQTARISGPDSTSNRKAGELRAGGSALVRTDHRINRDGGATQGYHHIIGVADRRDEAGAVTYANGFLSPNAASIQCAESAIAVLRYPSAAPAPTADNAPFFGMVA